MVTMPAGIAPAEGQVNSAQTLFRPTSGSGIILPRHILANSAHKLHPCRNAIDARNDGSPHGAGLRTHEIRLPPTTRSRSPMRCRRKFETNSRSASKQRVYILDALNIMRHRNETDDTSCLVANPPEKMWNKLISAAEYYQDHMVRIFIPRLHTENAQLKLVLDIVGKDSIVTTPSGISDDKFMISHAMDLEKSGLLVRIVTNDLFRDHGLSPPWVVKNTVKYAFAAGCFVPENIDK